MAVDVVLPKLGPEMEAALLVEWLVADGDEVSAGQAVATLETDKVDADIEAEAAGTIHLLAAVDTELPVGTVLARIGDLDGEPAVADGAAAPAPAPEPGPAPEPKPEPPRPAPADPTASPPADPTASPPPPPRGRLGRAGAAKASPLARRMAADHGLDLATLAGSVDGEPIRKRHVEAALQDSGGAAAGNGAAAGEKLTPMRRRIAERMLGSIRESAQTTDVREHEVTALVEFRREASRWAKVLGSGLGFTDLMIRAVALSLREVPALNASLSDDGLLVSHPEVNIGIAVATEDGLIVPVLKEADRLGFAEINARASNLVARARDGRLELEELSGGTFTISNIGSYGSHFGTPILVQGQLGILATGAIVDRPVVRDGAVVPGKTMHTSLTVDHRIIDGAVMGRFQNELGALLADPQRLVEGV